MHNIRKIVSTATATVIDFANGLADCRKQYLELKVGPQQGVRKRCGKCYKRVKLARRAPQAFSAHIKHAIGYSIFVKHNRLKQRALSSAG
jgi:hypothetical protein